jgi:hypothetical protein
LLSTNFKGRWFLTIKRVKSSINCFCYTSFFLKGYFATKKLDVELEETFGLFLEIIFHFPSKEFFFQLKNILRWSKLRCFFNEVMPFIALYIINPFLANTCGKEYNT